ncbi:unnamed protein product, partial [Amoebophrya sp. A25]|eukprot:GSA25T00022502001.1
MSHYGVVKYFSKEGFGFIKPADTKDPDIFVHARDILNRKGFRVLLDGESVSFDKCYDPTSEEKWTAINVTGKGDSRPPPRVLIDRYWDPVCPYDVSALDAGLVWAAAQEKWKMAYALLLAGANARQMGNGRSALVRAVARFNQGNLDCEI